MYYLLLLECNEANRLLSGGRGVCLVRVGEEEVHCEVGGTERSLCYLHGVENRDRHGDLHFLFVCSGDVTEETHEILTLSVIVIQT